MEYHKQSTLNGEKHLWKCKRLSFYAKNRYGNTWEIELGLTDYMEENLNVYRIANTASFQEATEIISYLLEIFDK